MVSLQSTKMAEPSEPLSEIPEEPQSAPEPATPKIRKERTEGQRLALEKARQKAMAVRAESAALRKKEAEVERAFAAKARADHAARVEAEFQALSNPEDWRNACVVVSSVWPPRSLTPLPTSASGSTLPCFVRS